MDVDLAPTPPNHHAHHPPFAGASGALAAAAMSVGRRADAELVARLIDLRADDHVVDVGCGPGTAVRHAARSGATATGVDPAPVMRRVARLLGVGRRRVRIASGDASSVPVADAAATVVWTIASVHHWPDVGAGVAEAARVLGPGGRFLAVERSTTDGATGLASHGWTDPQADAFADICRAAGFRDVRVEHHDAGRRRLVTVLGHR